MKIAEVGEVGSYLTEANEPILTPIEKVIGFRELDYRIYRPGFLSKSSLVEERTGWVWHTSKRVIHLDNSWEDLPGGKRGKKVHEFAFDEAVEVEWKRRAVRVHANGPSGKVVFEYRPFGAAARLFNWLKEEKEERKALAKGQVRRLYSKADIDKLRAEKRKIAAREATPHEDTK